MNPEFWSKEAGSQDLKNWIIIGLVFGLIAVFALARIPTRGRRPVVAGFTFISGLFYVMLYLWPTPYYRQPGDLPRNSVEHVGFWLADTLPVVKDFANVLVAILLGLGIYSLLRIHLGKLLKRGKDWQFSAILLVSMVSMVSFGYADWYMRTFNETMKNADLTDETRWPWYLKGFDILFDGLLQNMDAAMFSIIAFFILSAAYRAFRIRSIESTIMLATALILMLNLMGAVEYLSSTTIDQMTGGDPASFLNNFKLKEVADWIKNTVQVPSLRAIDLGIGIGALAMGLRLWLNLEKGGVGA